MFKKISFYFLLTATAISSQQGMSQVKDPVLLTVGGEKVTRSEFEKVYRKNNIKDANTEKKNLSEYLELFINYKLKVREAEEQKLDTSSNFKNELAGYRKQLSQPYLTDKDVSEKLIKEAYDRMTKDVHAAHILFRVSPDALPKDTLAAFNRAIKVRDSILKGADFNAVAKKISQDPSAKENGGDLGYFTAMQMVYPFESAAYNTKPGKISMPVRTRFGYHLIKVFDIRPAQGEIRVAHIMVKTKPGMSAEDSAKAKSKIDEIYKELKDGKKFEDLAQQFSDDPGSAKNGGLLPFFGTGRMVPEFEKAAFALKANGDFSEPIKSPYGWHIIKRIEKKDIPKFEEVQNDLKNKIGKDPRSEVSKTSFVNRIKREANFKEDKKARDEFYTVVDSTLTEGKWDPDRAKSLKKTLFSLQDKKYTQADFARFMADHQVVRKGVSPQVVVNNLYDQFVTSSVLAFEEERLDQKYPEFKALMQEYRDGILLFDLTDKKVWSKAIKDSVGLKAFYEKNKNNYMWPERVEAVIFTCANEEIAKKVRSMIKKKANNDKILAEVNKNAPLNLSVKEGKFASGENDFVDKVKWEKGISENIVKDQTVTIVNIKQKIPAQPKTLEEAKGLVTADYQSYLEKEWIDSLRAKYSVVVNKEVLSTIAE